MATLSLTQFLTLDGVHQAPGGPQEDPSGGFEHGGWSVPYGDEDFGQFMNEVFTRPTAFLLGRRTYEIFAGYWPKQTDPDDPVAGKLNALPKYVATTTLTSADWAGTTLLRGDVAKEVAELKGSLDGEIQMHGSGGLARTLLDHDLIDTLHLLVFPVILGAGRRLFSDGVRPTAFRHTAARTTGSGVAIHTYELAGRPEYGSY
ncbi:Dihydrofolate reductase [Streptomyces venezuelae]|uniref:dihydrofolate reductase family protein n=1 Tax=Streptomyces gardneri TaxID=66892 RepID=UPI0006BCC9A1|nr:dihydrofolate reductase family protein [Streptomyces gardneri]ALO11879.1 Dihydrofolate reductase [Streptomyces venezuelae]QPK48735.1 dihydrofolate reductase family protein [Streptomyces gardneri]WRK40214.1 dihydrofolate reductase family protein [Streptomyces venezuelae]CUM37563.1 Dihydrofolate reductase [Streptomyces venezuelae]